MSRYLNLLNTINRIPKFATIGNTTLTGAMTEGFANGRKLYVASGQTTDIPDCKLQLKFLERYFNDCKDEAFIHKVPFFVRTTETKPQYADRALVITKANGKGTSSSVTTVNSEGIRQYRVTKHLNKDGDQFTCTRYVYDDNGVSPSVVSTWVEKN